VNLVAKFADVLKRSICTGENQVEYKGKYAGLLFGLGE